VPRKDDGRVLAKIRAPAAEGATVGFELTAPECHVLQNGMYTVKKLLRLTPDPKHGPRYWVLTGGPIDFRRATEPESGTRFMRTDGGIVHFQMTLRECDARSIEVLAYGFEIYFLSRAPIAFVRTTSTSVATATTKPGCALISTRATTTSSCRAR
jgi:hypothetical protein